MRRIFVQGVGAVSAAGWGVAALLSALEKNEPLPAYPLPRPGWEKPLLARFVPAPAARPAFLAHPRVRRAGAITHYVIAAALEALGEPVSSEPPGAARIGVIVGVMAGGVSYSRRFYEEILKDPATASPLVFPETVFNAPASHLAAFLGSDANCCTLVGDDGTFLQGLALAARWLGDGQVDRCLVVGAEESDWIVADAIRLFHPGAVHGAGAGAVLLGKEPGSRALAELAAVTDSFPFTQRQPRGVAARKMRAQLPPGGRNELLCASSRGARRMDAAENLAWSDWAGARFAPRAILGEAFVAAAAWQCAAACDALGRGQFAAANVSVVGANQQAIGARLEKPES